MDFTFGPDITDNPVIDASGGWATTYYPTDLTAKVAELEAENAKLRKRIEALLDAMSLIVESED